MTKYLIDTHAHINFGLNEDGEIEYNNEQVLETVREMKSAGVKKVIIPAVDVKTLDRVSEMTKLDEDIFAMVGIFPTEAKTYTSQIEEKMFKIASCNKKIVAVGEIGLDYHYGKDFSEAQKEVFIKQIALANRLNLPVVVHDREAHKDTYDILKTYNCGSKVLFHCFSGSPEFMKECVKEGWYIAIGGVVTFKNAVKMKEVANEVPLNRLVLETDAPYLAPTPYRGKPNKPAYVKLVAQEIARIRDISFDEIAEITTKNAEEFFGI